MRNAEISSDYGNLALNTSHFENRNSLALIKPFKRTNFIKNAINNPAVISFNEAFQKSISKIEIDPKLGKESELKESGFDLSLEIRRFFQNYNTTLIETKNKDLALLSSYYELDANIRTFAREFIQGGLVLPMLIEQQGKEIVNSYDKQRVVDKITDQERRGSVRLASEKIEQFFAKNKGQVMGVINSPMGWTGSKDKEGSDYKYRDTQSLIFWRESDGILKGLTVVSDLTLEQGQKFLGSLGVDGQKLSGLDEKERIINMVSNPAEVKGSDRFKRPEDIVEALLEVRGEGNMRFHLLDGTLRTKTIQELRADLKRRNELLTFDSQTENLLRELKQFILKDPTKLADPAFQTQFTENIELVVLGITRSLNQPEEEKTNTTSPLIEPKQPFLTLESLKKADFSAEKAYLQKQAGCSKGIISSTKLFSSSLGQTLSNSSVNSIGGIDKEGGVCTSCGEENLCTSKCHKCGGTLT